MHAIEVAETGGPHVLKWVERPDPTPGPDQVIVDLAASGLNYIDTYHRSGLYDVSLPFVPGCEGAGIVSAVGSNVADLAVGDRVAWAEAFNAYATKVPVEADRAVPVPPAVDLDIAAAVMLQGMTAHYLVTDTHPLQAGEKCLIHAGAGGVGLLLIQMARNIGAEVFTTVGSPEKAELATAAGADHVILYRDVDFAAEVEAIAGPKALAVVYDGVGKVTFEPSLGLLRPRGMMVTFGNASGPVEPMSPLILGAHGSIFLTRPSLFHYIASREELLARASDLFDWIAAGKLDVRVGDRLPLSDAAEAHRRLEGRKTTGKVLLLP